MDQISKTPRIFVKDPLEKDKIFFLSSEQSHYVQNVLRLKSTDLIRVFNGLEGEWLASIELRGKTTIGTSQQLLRSQKPSKGPWLYFSLIKKHRTDFLIEKAVELGVSQLHPVITDRTIVKSIHLEKAYRHIIEAAEQCERLDIPPIASPIPLKSLFKNFPPERTLYFCHERSLTAHPFASVSIPPLCAIFVGPEGGLTPSEETFLLQHPQTKAISLGETILRSETAALCALSQIKGKLDNQDCL